MTEKLGKKSRSLQTWDKFKKVWVDEYSKLKINANKHSAKLAGFEMTDNIEVNKSMEDYVISTSKILATVIPASDQKYTEIISQQAKTLEQTMEMMKNIAKPHTPFAHEKNNTKKSRKK